MVRARPKLQGSGMSRGRGSGAGLSLDQKFTNRIRNEDEITFPRRRIKIGQHISLQPYNQLKLQNIFVSVGSKAP